mmetsp:Transcript_22998/g.62429  ORF Transcript_22998/g.62429 Transcript_22998/m.62429 type:complete len:877 (+) Transcript_22998:131-2761(+)
MMSAPPAGEPAHVTRRSQGGDAEVLGPTGALTARTGPHGAPQLTGVLLKRSTFLHHWKQRAVVIKGGREALSVTFFKRNEETRIALAGRGVSVVPGQVLYEKKFERELGHSHIHPFSLVAASGSTLVTLGCAEERSRDEWVRVLAMLIDGTASLDDLARGDARLSATQHERSMGTVPKQVEGVREAGHLTSDAAEALPGERWRLIATEEGVRVFEEETSPSPAAGAPWRLTLLREHAWPVLLALVPGALLPMGVRAALSLVVVCVLAATGLCAMLLGTAAGASLLRPSPISDAGRTGCVRTSALVRAPADAIFSLVMSLGQERFEWDSAFDGGRVIESLDRHSDVIYARLLPLRIGPFLVARRDACLMRYWRREGPGSFTVVLVSTTHSLCPEVQGCVRAEVFGSAITIRPARGVRGASSERCVVSHVLHLDPKGWVAWSQGMTLAYHRAATVSLRGLRHFLDQRQIDEVVEEGRVDSAPAQSVRRPSAEGRSVPADRSTAQPSPVALVVGAPATATASGRGGGGADADASAESGEGAVVSEEDSALADAREDAGDTRAFASPTGSAGPGPAFHEPREARGRESDGYPAVTAAAGQADSPQDLPPALSAASPVLRRSMTLGRTTRLPNRRAPSSPPAAMMERAGTLRRALHPEDEHCWDEPEAQLFKLRGKTYLQDRIKVPAAANSTLMQLTAVDLLRAPQPLENLAARPGSPAQLESGANLQLILNFQLPGPPCLSLVLYFAADRERPSDPDLLARLDAFSRASVEERNSVFKLIPGVAEGNWMVRRAVGQTPAIVGRALHMTYHAVPGRYVEIAIDVGSSSVAAGVLRIVKGAARRVVVDLAFLLEGRTEEELPEKMLAAVRMMYIDIDRAVDV